MRFITFLILFSFIHICTMAQNRIISTAQFGGTYSYIKPHNAFGTVAVYPETDSTVLFFINVNRGEPSYNMGFLYGRLKLTNGKGIFETADKGCRWMVQFTKNLLVICTIGQAYDCGFGNGVVADGLFKQTSKEIPQDIEDSEGNKHSFKTTSPEDFENE